MSSPTSPQGDIPLQDEQQQAELFLSEAPCILIRRKKQWQTDKSASLNSTFWHAWRSRGVTVTEHSKSPWQVKNDLVGLAFSGGGIRSAMFNLGFLQGLYRSGLLRYVDYLSTVSGGSYTGAHLSAHVQARIDSDTSKTFRLKPDSQTEDLSPVVEPKGKTQPPWMSLVQGGKYLDRPVRLAIHYVWGLLGNVLVFGSLMLFSCAFVAWLWRQLDRQPFVEWMRALRPSWRLDADLVRALLPTAVLFAVAGLLGLVRYLTYRRSGTMARPIVNPNGHGHFLASVAYRLIQLLPWASLAITAAVLMGNGDTSIGGLEWILPSGALGSASVGGEAARVVGHRLGVVQILQTLTTIIVFASAALPLIIPQRFFQSGAQGRRPWQAYVFGWVMFAVLVGIPALGVHYFASENVSGTAPRKRYLALHEYFSPQVAETMVAIESNRHVKIDSKQQLSRESIRDIVDHFLERLAGECDNLSTTEDQHRLVNLSLSNQITHAGTLLHEGLMQRDWESVLGRLQALGTEIRQCVGIPARLPAALVLPGHEDSGLARIVIHSMRERVDPQTGIMIAATAAETTNPREPWYAYGEWPSNEIGTAYAARLARVSNDEVLLERDQNFRFWWWFGALVTFVFAATLVDLNATSLHGFYAASLRSAYLNGPRRYRMSELTPWRAGAPYHIICASLNLVGRRLHKCRAWTYQFAPKMSGSSCADIGYAETEKHDPQTQELGNALAISGSALSPAQIESWAVALLLAVVNLRMGQWMHLPQEKVAQAVRIGKGHLRAIAVAAIAILLLLAIELNKGGPRPWWVLIAIGLCLVVSAFAVLPESWLEARLFRIAPWLFLVAERRPHAFLSDGGHNENLGLWPLVERRCKLIIACDASCDPKYEFVDLTRFMQRARMSRNIKFLSPDGDKPFDVSPLKPAVLRTASDKLKEVSPEEQRLSAAHFVLGTICYADTDQVRLDETATRIVYVKPGLTGTEPPELLEFFRREASFPHDTTTDQLFDEDQSEAYRQLGLHVADCLTASLSRTAMLGATPIGVQAIWNDLTESQRQDHRRCRESVAERRHMLVGLLHAYDESSAVHADTDLRFQHGLDRAMLNAAAMQQRAPTPWTPLDTAILFAARQFGPWHRQITANDNAALDQLAGTCEAIEKLGNMVARVAPNQLRRLFIALGKTIMSFSGVTASREEVADYLLAVFGSQWARVSSPMPDIRTEVLTLLAADRQSDLYALLVGQFDIPN